MLPVGPYFVSVMESGIIGISIAAVKTIKIISEDV
jgi:hypothetical protein